MTRLLFVLLALLPSFAFAQKIKIIDQTTLQPIEKVAVYNAAKKHHAVSNAKGYINLSAHFDTSDTLFYFQHASYQNFSLSKSEIRKLNFVVPMLEKTWETGQVVISANKWEQNSSEISNEIIRINPKEIAFHNPQTTADLIDQTGQVFVQKSQLGGGSPMLRGFSANAVLLVVDGVRMNNAIFRGGNLQNIILIDSHILGEAEVVFGPGSVIYGSDALGGVMDFHTKSPRFSTEKNWEVGGNALLRYATANSEHTGHLDFNIKGKKWSFLTSISASSFDDLRAGGNYHQDFPDFGKRIAYMDRQNGQDILVQNSNTEIQRFSGYEQLNLLQKVRFRPSEKLDLTYSLHYTTSSDVPRYDRLVERRNGELRNAEWYYGPQTWLMNNLRINWAAENKFFDFAKITLSQQRIDEDRNDRRVASDWLRTREEDVSVWSANLDFDKSLNEQHELYYGFALTHNQVDSKGIRTNILTGETQPTSSRYPSGGSDMTTLAAYFSYKYLLHHNWTLTAGGRYSHILLNADFSDKTFFDFPFDKANINTGAINGNLGLVFRPDPTWQWNANLSSGFRAPNVDDVGKLFDSEPGNVVVPNPDLAPEYSYNGELGFVKRIGKKAKLGITTYYTRLSDAIVRRNFSFNGQDSILYDGQLSQVQALSNAGKAYIWGYSAQLELALSKKLVWKNSISYTEGMDTTEDIPLRHIPPFFGQTTLSFKTKKFKGEFLAKFNDWKRFRDLAPSEQSKTHIYTPAGTPAWFTLNLRAAYQINPHLQLNTSLENLLDKHYRPFSSGISAAGRNFVIALRGSF